MKAEAAIATGDDWRQALDAVRAAMPLLGGDDGIDLALLFASADFAPDYADLAAEARRLTGARVLIGCSGQGVIGPGREIEDEAAIALVAFSLPGAELHPLPLDQADIADDAAADDAIERAGIAPADVAAWLVFADPFTLDPERLLTVLSGVNPAAPLVGGLASEDPRRQSTHLFLDGEVLNHGAVALALGGPYEVRTVVSQGCEPIGDVWTITAAEGNVIETIGMRRALDVLMESIHALPSEKQARARGNVFVGLAMDEYRDEFGRGDFLIRNLMGVDQERGVIAVSAQPRVGQTLQFQLRDPAAADEDLIALLSQMKAGFGDQQPIGALLCSCNGRGAGLFGAPDHDARVLSEQLGPLPVAGFFCNGEIGPIGGKPFLHGFTASIALILPK